MVSEGWIGALAQAGKARAETARASRSARLAGAVEAAFDGEIGVDVVDEGIRLRGRGLAVRMFGNRRRGPDPRLAWLAAWLTMGGY